MKHLPRGRTLDLFADEPAQAEASIVAHEQRRMEVTTDVSSAWRAVATEVTEWLVARGIDRREAIVLVPFVHLIDPLRRALAAGDGWLPRVETTRTLTEGLAPAPVAADGAPTLSAPIDRLIARKLLLGQRWGADWSRRDGLGFDQAIGRLVVTAHELLRAIGERAPASRAATWTALEQALTPTGRRERDLAAIAVRWAALAPPPRSDVLFESRPSAWVAIEAGGADALAQSLLAESVVPTLTLVLDPSEDALFDLPVTRPLPALGTCPGFEDEAQSAAAQVLAELAAGRRPVALVAHDRLLVRRAHELLVRSGAQVFDETGWRLSTTRAAAGFMALLNSARHDAGNDALLDWLKSGTQWGRQDRHAIAALEARVRRAGVSRVAGLANLALHDAAAERLRDAAIDALRPLQSLTSAPLAAWLTATTDALRACGFLPLLADDAAGAVLLQALLLDLDAAERAERLASLHDLPLGLTEFARWCDEVLEQATFRPEPIHPTGAADEGADVVVTPLARAMLRPFAAAVLPGCDARLGAWPLPDSLLPRDAAALVGIVAPGERQRRERLAFAQLLRLSPLTLLRRARDGAESLAPSRLVEQLRLSLSTSGRALREWSDPRITIEVPAMPVRRAEASAPGLVPDRLSATALETLRGCPYRFFAHTMLRLNAADEIEGGLDKRDWGNWLHEVLLRFHDGRTADPDPDDDAAALHAAARIVLDEHGLDVADFLPWQASFDAFVPRYLEFMRKRDRSGARWQTGEQSYTLALPAAGVELYGIVDRIDEVAGAGGARLQLIDYKAGSVSRWKDQAKLGFEDTQLAFYAALVGAASGRPVEAGYLALEARDALAIEPHKDVEASGRALVEGVVVDLTRLRGGAGLRALGEGSVCEWCDVRGLCRRDDWQADGAPVEAGGAGGEDRR